MRAERDHEVRALASKLEATLLSCNKSVAEAERMIEAKESMLAKWKGEALGVRTGWGAGGEGRGRGSRWCGNEVKTTVVMPILLSKCPPSSHPAQIAGKLERALIEHKREVSEQQMEAAELRRQVRRAWGGQHGGN